DICAVTSLILNVIAYFANFSNSNFIGTGNDKQQYVFGSFYFVVVQQWRIQCFADCLLRPISARSSGASHNGRATICKYGFGIAKVNVLGIMMRDYFGNSTSSGGQNFISL